MSLPLEEFQRLAGLSDSSLVWLLTKNKLPLKLDKEGIQVSTAEVEMNEILKAIATVKTNARALEKELLIEKLGKVIVSNLDAILGEAVISK